jgi:hypothetical protein
MKRPLLLGLCSCAVTGLIGCTAPATATRPPSPTAITSAATSTGPTASPTDTAAAAAAAATVTSYYQAIVAHSYPLAFSYIDAGATGPDGAPLTWQTLRQLATAADSAQGPVTDFSVAAAPPQVVITIARPRIGRYHAHLQIKHEAAGWKIAAIDRI